jgi:cytochrome P450
MVLNGAAGRDPGHFDNPGEFQIDRPNSREHLAFGRGPHACPGGPLARAEACISIEHLLQRMLDIKISESSHGPAGARRYDYVPTYILRGLQRLHLDFTPG